MKETTRKGSEQTVPVTIRLSKDKARFFQGKADAAFMSRSAYIAARLNLDEPAQYPALAALARVIAIQESVRTSGGLTSQELAELRAILAGFAKLARAEATR